MLLSPVIREAIREHFKFPHEVEIALKNANWNLHEGGPIESDLNVVREWLDDADSIYYEDWSGMCVDIPDEDNPEDYIEIPPRQIIANMGYSTLQPYI